jgi:hypothetical protein
MQVRKTVTGVAMYCCDIGWCVPCQARRRQAPAFAALAGLSVAVAIDAWRGFRKTMFLINHRTAVILLGLQDWQILSYTDSSRCASSACVEHARQNAEKVILLLICPLTLCV